MSKSEQVLGKAVYDAMLAKAAKANFVDRMILSVALESKSPYDALPSTQQKLFVDVGMAVVRALQGLNHDLPGQEE